MKRIGECIYDRLFEYILSLVLLAIMLFLMLVSREMMGADAKQEVQAAVTEIQKRAGMNETQFFAKALQIASADIKDDVEFRRWVTAMTDAQMKSGSPSVQVGLMAAGAAAVKDEKSRVRSWSVLIKTANWFIEDEERRKKATAEDVDAIRKNMDAPVLPKDLDSLTTATLGALPALAPMEKKGK